MMRKTRWAVACIAATMLTGCAGSSDVTTSVSDETKSEQTSVDNTNASVAETEKDASTSADETTAQVEVETVYEDKQAEELADVKSWSTIKLKDNTCSSSDNTVKIGDDNKVTIKEGGYYEVSGELKDGQLSVKTDESATVVIKLNGVNIVNAEKSPIKVKSAGKVIIYLADGSENNLTCGVKGQAAPANEEEDTARNAINSDYPLVICGSGTLNVYGYAKKGIHSNENVTITGGVINVESLTDGIKGDNGIVVSGGDITINSGNNAFKSSGNITIDGGRIDIAKSYEGIEADNVYINGGEIKIKSADDGINANNENTSSDKNGVVINGGSLFVNSEGDGIDSNSYLVINGGYVDVDGPENSKNSALDSGVEAGGLLLINGGTVFATGAKGGMKEFDETSVQKFVCSNIAFDENDIIKVEIGDGVYTHSVSKSGGSVLFSCAELTDDAKISVESK